MEQPQGSQITADQIKDSEAQMLRLRDEIDNAHGENEIACAVAAFNLAEWSHRELCAQQAQQLQQIYMRQFIQRMRTS